MLMIYFCSSSSNFNRRRNLKHQQRLTADGTLSLLEGKQSLVFRKSNAICEFQLALFATHPTYAQLGSAVQFCVMSMLAKPFYLHAAFTRLRSSFYKVAVNNQACLSAFTGAHV
jgi:hypothetical protein